MSMSKGVNERSARTAAPSPYPLTWFDSLTMSGNRDRPHERRRGLRSCGDQLRVGSTTATMRLPQPLAMNLAWARTNLLLIM